MVAAIAERGGSNVIAFRQHKLPDLTDVAPTTLRLQELIAFYESDPSLQELTAALRELVERRLREARA